MWHYLTKYEKAVWSVTLIKTAHWYGLNFLCPFSRPENLKLQFSEKLAALTFLKEKVSTFAEA